MCGQKNLGKTIYPLEKLPDICRRLHIGIGIIAVPGHCAQEICDLLVSSGIKAIWNFAPVHLLAAKEILVQNENMAVSLALLSQHLEDRQKNKEVENN